MRTRGRISVSWPNGRSRSPKSLIAGRYPGEALRVPGRSGHSHEPWPLVRRDQGPLPQLRPPGHHSRCRSSRRDSSGSRLGWSGPGNPPSQRICRSMGGLSANAKPARGKEVAARMTCTLHVAWDERLTDYHFGPGHPMAPVRVELTMRLAYEFGLWTQPGITLAAPAPAADADLELVHDAPYITAVEAVSRWAEHPDARDGLEGTQLRVARMFGLGAEDNPVFPGMHEAS